MIVHKVIDDNGIETFEARAVKETVILDHCLASKYSLSLEEATEIQIVLTAAIEDAESYHE